MSVVSPAQLDWLSHEPETASAARPSSPISTTAAAGKLWLCLHLPDLPLEVLEGYEPDEAVVVTEVVGQRVEVSAASPAACQGGIEIGMSQAAAQALCPTLRLEPCDPGTELLRLEALARWLGGWSSWVSVVPPSRLLLEVGGSQKLFGGLCEIQRSITAGLGAHGHRVQTAIACSSRAAAWLAPWQAGVMASDADKTRQAVAALPVQALGLPSARQRRLQRAGLHSLGQLLRLPRDGLARRYGQAIVRQLDEALGLLPEVVPRFALPQRFAATVDLPLPESATPRLLVAAEHLIERLIAYLRAHDAAVDRLRLILIHESQPISTVVVGLAMAGRDGPRMLRLLGEHLDRFELPNPVLALRLEAPRILPLSAGTQDWLEPTGDDDWLATVERWQARLGSQAVQGLGSRADHRPEQAWQLGPLGRIEYSDECPIFPRPLWLLRQPQPLVVRANQPTYNGSLVIETGPERIEQGWWDTVRAGGGDISRDYYVMRDRFGTRLWVFQDRQQLGWWLHGYFA